MKFRPLLAYSPKPKRPLVLEELRYPLLVSPKFDGIRAVVTARGLLSRTLKRVPNRELQQLLSRSLLCCYDGELVLGDPAAPDCYHRTESQVMSADGGALGITFWVFDYFQQPAMPYTERLARLRRGPHVKFVPRVKLVPQFKAGCAADVQVLEELYVAKGFEGIMLRSPDGLYKCGRSTLSEQYLIKVKRFEDSEARVLAVYPRQRNNNAQTRDERGYAKRSTAKAGKVATKMLGGFHCRDLKTGVEFDCGTGTLKREELALEGWVGTVIKYRFQPSGVKDKPRYPRFVGRRKRSDR